MLPVPAKSFHPPFVTPEPAGIAGSLGIDIGTVPCKRRRHSHCMSPYDV